MSGVILGKDNTLAGFQTLGTETDSGSIPLMARWEDRIVLAFPLLTVMQRLELPLSSMEIRLGEYLKLGPAGPIVPIDRFGRMKAPEKPIRPLAQIQAEQLIDGGNDLLPENAPGPVILRDDRSAAEPATRAFSKRLPAVIASLASDAGLSAPHAFPRPRAGTELILLSLAAFLLTALCGKPAFIRNIAFLVLAAACICAQCVAAASASVWLPGLSALAAILTAFLTSGFVRVDYNAPKPLRVPREKKVKTPPAPKPVAIETDSALSVIKTVKPATPKPQASKPRKSARRGKKGGKR
jgi:hypothetical protein